MLGRTRFLCWGVNCIRKVSIILCIKSLSVRLNILLKLESTKIHFLSLSKTQYEGLP